MVEKKATNENLLKKTTLEQTLLRTIDALKSTLEETKDPDRRAEINEQIRVLHEQLMALRGRDYTTLENENRMLKEKIKKLEEALYSVKGKCAPTESDEEIITEHEALDRDIKLKYRLYKLLLERYSEPINKIESKTVGEIKAMIDASDLSLQALLEEIKGENYQFERDYLRAAKALYDFIKDEIECVDADLNLNFWLTPKEILLEKIGDDEDIAVFLCSGLYGLGDEKAEVLVCELENLAVRAVVITEFKDKFILLDPGQKVEFDKFCGQKDDVLAKYEFKGAKIKRFIYKFNRNNYEQFLQEEES